MVFLKWSFRIQWAKLGKCLYLLFGIIEGKKNGFWNFLTFKDRPFQCSKCSKTFNSTTQLEHHIARVHELRNCETCPHCGKIYSRLKAHLLTCNVRGLDRVAHECPGCDRKFLDKQNFKKHLEKCEGEGNFSRNNNGNIEQYVLKRTRRW